jgi:proteasome assembly chaperone (PAC2) family protein
VGKERDGRTTEHDSTGLAPMAEKLQLNHPWLVAIWPGMGNVALNAGIYLLAKLNMSMVAELEANHLFDLDQVEVKEGIIQKGQRPRNRFFVWTDPNKVHDIVVFLGEVQPPIGKFHFCRQLIAYAKELGVERVFTFAAMATQMHPEQPSRVFGASTDAKSLEELKRLELEILQNGNIGGLNGVLLGAAAESGLRGTCLLGEIPHIFSQFPFPKASLAILEVFTTISGFELDFTEMAEQAKMMEEQLGELLARVEQTYSQHLSGEGEEYTPEPIEEEKISPANQERIEKLFEQAARDRSKAFELKQELDRLSVFKDYEDRFLDLFKKS